MAWSDASFGLWRDEKCHRLQRDCPPPFTLLFETDLHPLLAIHRTRNLLIAAHAQEPVSLHLAAPVIPLIARNVDRRLDIFLPQQGRHVDAEFLVSGHRRVEGAQEFDWVT